MAETPDVQGDPLSYLRQSIASSSPPTLSSSSSADTPVTELGSATHLVFTSPTAAAFPFDTPTRFIGSGGDAVDLRSIFFAWQHKDDPVADSIAAAETLNASLADAGVTTKVQNLPFVERLDLVTWLEGSSNESEFIQPLESDRATQAPGAAQAGTGAVGTATVPTIASARPAKTVDPRLQEIFNNERRMGDRNSVLRGIKPTVGDLSAQ
jgi:parafibromin